MVASIPNDIFQFSTHAALNAGFKTGQPRTADLTTHGTHGLGIYEDGRLMLLSDGRAFALDSANRATPAPMHAALPFAMVTVFKPTAHTQVPSVTMTGLEELVTAQSVNSLLSFKLSGRFRVELARGTGKEEVEGTGCVFGFVVPAWMEGISGPRIHAHFLDEKCEVGGRVLGFSAEEAALGTAKCGRFHLGFPQGSAWEDVRL